MSKKEYPIFDQGLQASPQISQLLALKLQAFLQPLLESLDRQLDKRLVATFLTLVQTIVAFRDQLHGLLLSELGGVLLSPRQAPAGTKRISNLLRSPKWSHSLIEAFLWTNTHHRLDQLHSQHQPALLIWDESVLEKPESLKNPDLCPVRSSKAARLSRLKPGYYRPPSRPVFVPGLHWLGLILVGLALESGPWCLVHLKWWTSRGAQASDQRSEEATLLAQCVKRFGGQVWHVWDRGYNGNPWLQSVFSYHTQVRFVMRWSSHYKLAAAERQPAFRPELSLKALELVSRPAWQLFQGKRSRAKYNWWDSRRNCKRLMGVVYCEVRHPQHPAQALWLVATRPGSGLEPWYLLTNQPVRSVEQAWQIVLIYGRRWQIEMAWRFAKHELGLERLRVWGWENRLKLLMLASLAFGFLLSLVQESKERSKGMCEWLVRNWCHRTGRRLQKVYAPLYRLRKAVSELWQAHRPNLVWVAPQNSG